MKFISVFILSTISLCVACCSAEDEPDFNTSRNFDVVDDTIIQIENNVTAINLGETIYIETAINNFQTENSGEQFFITDYFPQGTFLGYRLVLYKASPYGNMASVGLNNDSLTVIDGQAEVDNDPINNYIEVLSDIDIDAYTNKFGVTVLEPGTYYLGAEYFTNNGGRISIHNYSDTPNRISIRTSINNANADGLYEFSVN